MASSELVGVLAEDAGAAAALAPVIERLTRTHEVALFALGRAAERFAAAGLSWRGADALAPEALSLLLTGTTAWGERIEARAIREARSRGVPTIGFVDFWSNYAERFRVDHDLDALPDDVAVVDEAMRAAVLALGVPPARVHVTGSPALDAATTTAPLGLPRGEHVLFLSQPLEALYGRIEAGVPHAIGYTEREVIGMVAEACARAGRPLRVRPHPREDRSALGALLAVLPGDAAFAADEPLDRATASAHAVVAMTTMALVEAALRGDPTLSVQPCASPLALPTIASGATSLARDAESVARWLAHPAACAVPAAAASSRSSVERLVALVESRLH